MPAGRSRSGLSPPPDLREQLADEAARIMLDHGIEDYAFAKRKAAERLRVVSAAALPSNVEIHERLVERQRLFDPDKYAARLEQLRRVAVQVMDQLDEFRPKLVGGALDGSATLSAGIELHVFSDSPELVAERLHSHGSRPRNHQRCYRFGRDDAPEIPGFECKVDGEAVAVMVFPERGSQHAPLSAVDGRPMRRASRGAVLALLGS